MGTDCDDDAQTDKVNELEKRWGRLFYELQEFKRETSNCNVPYGYPKNKQLANWVQLQRQTYARGSMREDRFQRLNDIGFVWVRGGAAGSPAHTLAWFDRLNELEEFKKEHGHTNVPASYSENPALGNWVQRQRRSFKEGTLVDDRVECLNKIGFEWSLR